MVKIGIIGAGRIGKVHAKAASNLNGAKIIWLADPIAPDLEETAKSMGIEKTSKNYKDILKKLKSLIINKKMQKSYEELKSLSFVFELYNNFDKILLDFSIESQLGYYNGIIFKGYIKESNDIILSGGRYDKLLNKFNSNKNAIGFAIYMDKLYEKNKSSDYIDILISYKSGDEKILLSEVRKFMNKNKKVRVDIYGDNSIENYKDKYIFDKDKLIKY